ncbi:D-aminoacylase [subsurface metagenome]
MFSFGFTAPTVSSPAYDVIIENGTIIDGTGNPGYLGDLGIRNGRIIAIGNLEEVGAGRRIDATEMFVTPGFIDIHTHADGGILREPWGPLAENFIREGVTTVIGGNCGGSKFTIGEHLAKVEKSNPSINYAILVGFGTIRELVMGMEDRAPTPDELNKMKELVAQSMEEGALGLSTGLYYTPDFYASTEEVIELAKVVAKYGGIYTSHIRDESDYNIGVIAAVKEAIAIGEAAGIPVEISHIKCLGTPVWNKSEEILELIRQAQLRGVNVLADQYAYDASGTSISGALIPRWVKAGTGTSLQPN